MNTNQRNNTRRTGERKLRTGKRSFQKMLETINPFLPSPEAERKVKELKWTNSGEYSAIEVLSRQKPD